VRGEARHMRHEERGTRCRLIVTGRHGRLKRCPPNSPRAPRCCGLPDWSTASTRGVNAARARGNTPSLGLPRLRRRGLGARARSRSHRPARTDARRRRVRECARMARLRVGTRGLRPGHGHGR
jgi:hypothetical protein